MMRILLLTLAYIVATCNAAAAAQMSVGLRQRMLTPIVVGVRRATMNSSQQRYATKSDLIQPSVTSVSRGGTAICDSKPPVKLLQWAYAAAGMATTAGWGTMAYTTIRDNQPAGAMMPCWQHPVFARIGAMSAASLILGSFASLAATCCESDAESWEELGDSSPSFRRQNLALATTGVASSLWVRFADVVTKIPGSNPVASHQSYSGIMQSRLIGAYGSAGLLGALVWARCLPEDSRNPLTWPKRIGDGVSKAIVSIAPKDVNDPVQVKYALITSSMLIFTGMQTVCNMPVSVIPSWTSRRLSRAFPIYTFLGAVTAFDLKEATENGRILVDKNYRYLSSGIKGFGALYLGARAGAICFDPSFPEHFGMVNQVPGLAVAAMLMVGLTLRSDER
mmetsp:Transcript_19335/g.29805  ORF Transcript_19335/g.29805 Transcript_19335/m.29805 type:complete len:393 (-) Transcript_19335:203-1381(-)